jgi:hypothetical protein
VGHFRLKLPRLPKPSPRLLARSVVVASGSSVSVGAGQMFGGPAGLMVAGVLGIAYGLLLMDVDEEG